MERRLQDTHIIDGMLLYVLGSQPVHINPKFCSTLLELAPAPYTTLNRIEQ